MSAALLETVGLSKSFGGVAALSDINFRLEEGELRCLIGPNGAGKSTFFKCLTGQYRPSGGRVSLRGKNIIGSHDFEIARMGVGVKMQAPSVFEELTVAENVWVAAARLGSGRAVVRKARGALERLRVDHLASRQLSHLSHGQRQLVELAMVLVADPGLILLDEPAAGMTGVEISNLVALITELNLTHTLIVVEHDMAFIRRLAGRVTVFNRGRILMEGETQSVLENEVVRKVYLGSGAV